MSPTSRRVLLGITLGAIVGILALATLAAAGFLDRGRPSSAPSLGFPSGPPPVSATPATGQASPSVPPDTAPTDGPSAAAPAILVGAGDIADCTSPGDEATADLLETIPGTVFTLGDNVYDRGTPAEYANCYDPSWGRPSIKERTRPVAGNHEYGTAGAAGYYGYFGAAAGDPTEGWYAYDHDAWRVYVLNSNCQLVGGCEAGSTQERWLRTDLAANPRACVLAMWHHPRFSSGEHGSDAVTRALWQALYDANAELILVGHDHDYERFGPQTATGQADGARGLVQIVVGTGGRSHRAIQKVQPNSLVRNDDTYGVLRLSLSAESYTFDFIPVAGQTFTDTGTGTCH